MDGCVWERGGVRLAQTVAPRYSTRCLRPFVNVTSGPPRSGLPLPDAPVPVDTILSRSNGHPPAIQQSGEVLEACYSGQHCRNLTLIPVNRLPI